MKKLLLSLFCLCLLIPSASRAEEQTTDQMVKGKLDKTTKFSIYTDKQLDEALGVSDRCKASGYTNTHYDCDCLGLTYLELRRTKGDDVSHYTLQDEAKRKCPNSAAMAGKIYSECVGWAPRQRGEDYEEFCACYGSNYAKIYAKNPSENLIVSEAQMTVAMEKCDVNSVNRRAQDRDAFVNKLKENKTYERLFPGAKPDGNLN